jgi:hypothetical protein
MGTICTNNFEKEEGTETVDTYKNAVQLQINLGSNCIVHLIHGISHLNQDTTNKIAVKVCSLLLNSKIFITAIH